MSGRVQTARENVFTGWRRVFGLIVWAGLSAVVLTGCDSSQSAARPSVSETASAQEMVRLLEASLPQGKTSGQRGEGVSTKPGTLPSAELVFQRGGRSAHVQVMLGRIPVPLPAEVSQCPDTAVHPYSRCTITTLPDGATLVQDQSPHQEKNPSGGKVLTARLIFDDGRQILVSQVADPQAKADSAVTALPLTLKQLTAVATSSTWEPVLNTVPTPPAGGSGGWQPTGKEISLVLEQLLPAGISHAQPGGTEGFGHLVVDDGHGKSLVAVNVQRWKPSDDGMAKLFAKGETLPDGTRLSIRKNPANRGDKGTIEWTVDTFRKDGIRIVVSALNAPAYALAPTRPDPALDIAELKKIALDPAWQRVTRR
ncbi:hypothetical protein OG568_50745 (plasmid) [Streptomyces sp. NBC_01450]|uniref:hypothetical protein n=1 Tax=Streptomyces sp. NBC_01450 TaxID=2903871 RepID=UPI002E3781CF|nr:hypothetical protein [Streptomyces sp. NBC_01450]